MKLCAERHSGEGRSHKDSKSTEVYARLAIDPIKDAMANAQDAMFDTIKSEVV